MNRMQQEQSVFSAKPEPVQYVPAAHSVQFVDEEAPAASISNSDRYKSFWHAQCKAGTREKERRS